MKQKENIGPYGIETLLWESMKSKYSSRAIVREAIMKFNQDDNMEDLLVTISLCIAARKTGK